MCQVFKSIFESIKVENKLVYNLELHQSRLDNTQRKLFSSFERVDLSIINTYLKDFNNLDNGLYKCRISYGEKLYGVEFERYKKKEIHTLKLVIADDIEYSYKYKNRSNIDKLYVKKGGSDDILIVRNDLITDSSFANILFYDGKQWHTPSSPLLAGTQRQYLINIGQITEKVIRVDDLKKYTHFKLVNAMINFENAEMLETRKIKI